MSPTTPRRRAPRPAASFPALVGGFLLLACLVSTGCDPARRPAAEQASAAWAENVVVITVDTLRADAVGFAGGPPGVTPALDRLAAGGLVFPRAHAHAVLTLPSHASILSGLYPHQHGVRDNSGYRLAADVPTLGSLLSGQGFATAAFVAAFPLDSQFGLDRGFETYDDRLPGRREDDVFALAERPGDEVVTRALSWWRAHGDRRRLLWVHVFEPHGPYAPREPHATRFAGQPYHGEVATADALLAPLLDELAGEETTLVVFTSDHGEGLGDHGEATHGLFAYESTLRVPLVLSGGGVAAGVDDRLARHVDLLPTLLAAVGTETPSGLPGRSLLAPDAGGTTSYFEALHATLNLGWAPLRGTVDGDAGLKYIELPLPELYDLANDPSERHNLVDERRGDAGRLDRALPDEQPWPPDKQGATAAESTALAGLGYLTGTAGDRRRYTAADDPKNLVDLDGRMHRMHRLFADRRFAEAEREVRAVLERRGDMEAAWSFLAQVLISQGRELDAVVAMEEAGRRGLASPALARQHGLALAWLGRPREAIAVLEPLAPAGDPATLNALGTALVEAGRAEEAIAVLQRIFDRDAENARACENLSMAYLALERWSDAAAAARMALALDSGRSHAWNNLGVALYRLGDGAGALEAWQRAVAYDAHAFDTLYNLGVKAAELGRPELARQALAVFVATAPRARYARDVAYAQQLLARLETLP